MAIPVLELVTGVMIVSAIVVVRLFKDRIKAESVSGYRSIGGGLGLLALAMLMRVYELLSAAETQLVWGNPMLFDLSTGVLVVTGTVLIASGLSQGMPDLRSRWRRRRIDLESATELLNDFEPSAGLQVNLPRLARVLRESYGVEFVSLVTDLGKGTFGRFSVGANHTLLREIGVPGARLGETVTQALRSGRSITCRNLVSAELDLGPIMNETKYAAVTVLPVAARPGRSTVLCLGFNDQAAMDNEWQGIRPVVKFQAGLMARYERYAQAEQASANQLQGLANLGQAAADGTALRTLFQQASDMLAGSIGSRMVRISTYDTQTSFLNSRALSRTGEIAVHTPRDGRMTLALMPYHRLVRESGRLMLINQDATQRKVAPAEARQMYGPSLKSALLVPVVINEVVVGVISLADDRDWEHFGFAHRDVVLTKAVAGLLGSAIGSCFWSQKKSQYVSGCQLLAEILGDPEQQPSRRIKSATFGTEGQDKTWPAGRETSGLRFKRHSDGLDRLAVDSRVPEDVAT